MTPTARLTRLVLIPATTAAVIAAVAVAGLRSVVNDDHVPVARSLLAPGEPKRVLAVWAHEDDEITAAGTLAALAKDGAEVTLVYLTHGEGAHFTGYTVAQLYRMRPEEAKAAGKALGAAEVVVLDYGDGKLPQADAEKAKGELKALIDTRKPTVVISFDEKVGYYGHADHAQVGR